MTWTIHEFTDDSGRSNHYAVWLTVPDADPDIAPVATQILGHVTLDYLEGFFAGIENTVCYGPFTSEHVAALRSRIYDTLGLRL